METVPCKSIVTATKGTDWFGGSYNMNIYRGCCHGCIYCDSRSDCYGELRFDTVKVKENALEVIRNDLRRKVKPGVVSMGAMSDPYNPLEEDLLLTQNALVLLHAYGFGVALATKSPLVTRDIQLLQNIGEQQPAIVKITVTTADDALCKLIEPAVAPTSQRIAALAALSEAGVFCGILMMPLLPFINDNEENVLRIVAMAKEAGASFIYPAFGVTQRVGQRDYFQNKLETHFPGMGEKYQSYFGDRYECASPRAKALYSVFAKACDAAGIHYKMQNIIIASKRGYGDSQLTFFK